MNRNIALALQSMPTEIISADSARIEQQMSCFEKGANHIKLLRAATLKAGIQSFSSDERQVFVDLYTSRKSNLDIVKFVPASGAASRMFKQISAWIENPTEHRKLIMNFFKEADKLAFMEVWSEKAAENGLNAFELSFDDKVNWLKVLVQREGLGLDELPKGLIPFHKYEHSATAVEEHIYELMEYANGKSGAKVHFTISKEYEAAFKEEVARALEHLGFNSDQVEISYSSQKSETDTLSTNSKGEALKDENGQLLFRPGGHGALLQNLNDLDAEIIFIKNIDNVSHRRFKDVNVENKLLLGGVLITLRDELLMLHNQVSKGLVDAVSIDQVRDRWGLRIPREYLKLKEYIKRPIRVCGMVKNQGEPGGGPFWCADKRTGESLQIVEQFQVDRGNMRQEMILSSSAHFNPVDLVCCVRDLEDNKINLNDFVDDEQYFIAEKIIDGETVKVLEWPGLWNGAMANWITVFVEVPIETFNPVKELNDLLRPNHLG